MSNCFCHLNGYEVKDAKARSDINKNKSDISNLDKKLTYEVNSLNDIVNGVDNSINEKVDNEVNLINRNIDEKYNSLNTKTDKNTDDINSLNIKNNNNTNDISSLNSRLNELSSLEEGSTTGDAELQDIRIGYNGLVYDSAGDSVRGQIGDIYNKLILDTNINLFDGCYTFGSIDHNEWTFVCSTWVLDRKNLFNLIIVPVNPNTKYSVIKNSSDTFKIASSSRNNLVNGNAFDGSVKINTTANNSTFTTGENDKYLYILTSITGQKPFVQIVEGEQTTITCDYYPYHLPGLSIKEINSVKTPYNGYSLIAYGNSEKDINVTYNSATNKLKNENPFSILLGYDLRGMPNVITIPAFEKTITRFQIVYLLKSEIVDDNITDSMIHISEYWSNRYKQSDMIPLFWNSNNTKIYNSLNIEVKESSSSAGARNIVWFGDSISKLKLLPHRVGDIIKANVIDTSVNGSVMCYQIEDNIDYETLGFYKLTEAIKNNDYSEQDIAIANLKTKNPGSDYDVNYNNLKGIDWDNITDLVFMYGTNDYYHGVVPIGTGDKSVREYKGTMMKAIENILSTYPHVRLYCISPIWRGDGNTTNSQGKKLEDYVQAEKEVCEKYGVPYFDIYHNGNINEFNKDEYLTSDYVHQSDKGDVLIAEKISRFINSN